MDKYPLTTVLLFALVAGCSSGGGTTAADGAIARPPAHPEAGGDVAGELAVHDAGAAGDVVGQVDAGQVDAGDAAACLSANAQGFAFNLQSACADAGADRFVYAGCTLNGQRYVGCIVDTTPARSCVASCP
jgi:hypothetical protein